MNNPAPIWDVVLNLEDFLMLAPMPVRENPESAPLARTVIGNLHHRAMDMVYCLTLNGFDVHIVSSRQQLTSFRGRAVREWIAREFASFGYEELHKKLSYPRAMPRLYLTLDRAALGATMEDVHKAVDFLTNKFDPVGGRT